MLVRAQSEIVGYSIISILKPTRCTNVKVKVKQSRYRPAVAQRLPGS